jgi:hypothetical protein
MNKAQVEFTKEELICIKDVMNVVTDISNNDLASSIIDKLESINIPDMKVPKVSFQYVLEAHIEEEQESECNMTYDCQDMPDEVREDFFQSHDAGNDCHVTEYVESGSIVGDFLIEEGFSDGDEVIVKHWW